MFTFKDNFCDCINNHNEEECITLLRKIQHAKFFNYFVAVVAYGLIIQEMIFRTYFNIENIKIIILLLFSLAGMGGFINARYYDILYKILKTELHKSENS